MKKLQPDKMYQMIFDHAAEGIYLITSTGEFVTANPAFAFIFGYESPEEFATHISNPWDELFRGNGQGQREKLRHILLKKGTVTGFESQAYRKDGSVITTKENIKAVMDKKGNVMYFRGSVEDITVPKQNAESFQESEAQLRFLLERAEANKDILLDIIDEACDSYWSLEQTFITVVRDIVTALDSRRWWTRKRSDRVASHALKIAEEMGFHEDEKRALHIGALLHDIGQSVFHDELIDKPIKLTTDEMELIRRHPEQGAAVLQRSQELRDVMPLIRCHHERVDGEGYPDGLKGDDIPLGARIIHVATTYDAIVADRPYRPAQGREYALREIVQCTNTQFDPNVAEAALRVL